MIARSLTLGIFRSIQTVLMIALFSILPLRTVRGQWQQLQSLGHPFDCGFAIDNQTILIGSGSGVNGKNLQCDPVQIYKTIDGGTTWHLTTAPAAQGAITSIFMADALSGYATIFSCSNSSASGLWKTVDGGENWTDLSQSVIGFSTCVYATSKSLILAQWYYPGGSSIDGGRSFSQELGTLDNEHSNGIDFSDDNTGVVSVLQIRFYPAPFYFTSDAGLTWHPSSMQKEAWSVYGKKCTQTFFTANEDSVPNQTVNWSTDGGQNWSPRYTFPDPKMRFTGHIAGRLNTLYLQTDNIDNRGMYRSDDNGLSWKSIAGPSNNRDTRFVVTGSHGQIVFAFDNNGGIWKTTNGGDGTLQGGAISSKLFSLSSDTVSLVASNCEPDTVTVDLRSNGCLGVTIDSAVISPNTLGEFDAKVIRPNLQPGGDISPIELRFVPKNASDHRTTVHVYAHSSTTTFDTILTVIGINLSTISLHFGSPISAKIGDTIDVPIFLQQTNDPFSISSLQVTYSFDGDVLTPVSIETKNTLMAGAITSFGAGSTLNSSVINLSLGTPLTQPATNFVLPLLILKMRVTLSHTSTTDLTLSSLIVNNGTSLVLCAAPSVPFQAILYCGDSTIKTKMAGGDVAKLLNVQPNPMRHALEDTWYFLPSAGTVDLDLMDERGVRAATLITSLHQTAGTHHLQFNSTGWTSGSYFLRLSVGGVPTSIYKLLQTQ